MRPHKVRPRKERRTFEGKGAIEIGVRCQYSVLLVAPKVRRSFLPTTFNSYLVRTSI
jgi:hypothetical protein